MVNPPTIAPACAAAERRHLGVWSACAAEGKCIAPYAHIVLLDLVCMQYDLKGRIIYVALGYRAAAVASCASECGTLRLMSS